MQNRTFGPYLVRRRDPSRAALHGSSLAVARFLRLRRRGSRMKGLRGGAAAVASLRRVRRRGGLSALTSPQQAAAADGVPAARALLVARALRLAVASGAGRLRLRTASLAAPLTRVLRQAPHPEGTGPGAEPLALDNAEIPFHVRMVMQTDTAGRRLCTLCRSSAKAGNKSAARRCNGASHKAAA
jgi:hypothetical protein